MTTTTAVTRVCDQCGSHEDNPRHHSTDGHQFVAATGSDLAVTPGDALAALAPEKPRKFIEKALSLGLTVRQGGNVGYSGSVGWTITSPNPIDDWRIWLYFTPGARGGSLTISRFRYSHGLGRTTTTKLTRSLANIALEDMGAALARHHARQAATATESPRTERPAMQNVAATVRSVAAPARAAVAAVKSPPALDADGYALAVVLAGTLKANARFAVRMAGNGHIPFNTPRTLRAALVSRGVVSEAGGMLTTLGREVRKLIMT